MLNYLSPIPIVQKKIAEFLQSSLERLPNVKVAITSIPYTQLITRQAAKDYELTVKKLASDHRRPDQLFRCV